MTATRSAAHAPWILHTIGDHGALTLGQLLEELIRTRSRYSRRAAERVILAATHRLTERGELHELAPPGWSGPCARRWALTDAGRLELERIHTRMPEHFYRKPPLHPSERPRP